MTRPVIVMAVLALLAGAAAVAQNLDAPLVYHVPGMDSVECERNVPYRDDGGAGCAMDVYSPRGTRSGAVLPAIMFIHGGYLPRTMTPLPKDWGVYRSYGALAAASGMVGVTFNHRYYGWSRAELDTSFGDVAAAIRFVRSNAAKFHIDPEKICLWAFSGGGPHLAVPFMEEIGGIRCLVSYYGLLDIRPAAAQAGIDTAGSWLDRYTPGTYLTAGDAKFPPMLIARAGLDNPGLNGTVDRFLARALRMNKEIELLTHPRGVHGFDILNDDARSREIISRTVEFIRGILFAPVVERDAAGPDPARLYALIMNGDVQGAKNVVGPADSATIARSRISGIMSEAGLNTAGYWLIGEGNVQAAIDVLRWVVELHPRSPNAYDSLGDAYAAAGNGPLAIKNARRALELLENAPGMSDTQRGNIRRSANEKLQRFR